MVTGGMNVPEKVQMAHELRLAIRELKDRGLVVAAKWASELLSSLPKDIRQAPYLPFSPPLPSNRLTSPGPRQSLGEFLPSPGPGVFNPDGSMTNAIAGPSSGRMVNGTSIEEEEDMIEEDNFQQARTYFDLKEFDRVVWFLRDSKGKRARFLRTYAAFLSADRKAQESLPHFLDTKEERIAIYGTLNPLIAELADDTDPYLLYLRGIMYMRIDQRVAATNCFVESVKQKPYNWSAWSQLGQLVKSADMFIDLKERLPTSTMMSFFAINVMLDLHTATDLVMSMISELQEIFPDSAHLKAQRALVYYHMREFITAEEHFDAMQKADPFRMEEIDIFSNMLYVMDKRAKLGKLAHEYAELDRNRAEVCCLIGNYYSSRGDHTKAIIYFKRGLLLNREYLPAWTLMGHEYVELKNSHAAIEAYRKAIDINPKDYRAWYGLGQAYELLDMPMYAIEYYNQATSLRPYDCRMWSALATVYESLNDIGSAIHSHSRALLGADKTQTPQILEKLATLHYSLSQSPNDDYIKQGVSFHQRLIALGDQPDTNTTPAELAGSYLAVAEYEMRSTGQKDTDKDRGDWALAARYLEKVAATNAPQRDKAEELLRSLRYQEAKLAAGL